ncbi:MAG TPA: hypothetical protein VGN63_01430 [Flavisolibacter sp.]|jgi:hypothetical protein|nr:hypothetical protein [Flavisolibacter sp.]
MSPHFRLKKLTAYPAWHQKPLLLTCAEMADPSLVLAGFFDRYHLPNIRVSLQQLLEDALKGTEEDAHDHFHTHANIARLVEAAWLILEQEWKANADEGFDKTGTEEKQHDVATAEGEEERRRFVKWTPFPASLKAGPLAYLKRVFAVTNFDLLAGIITTWQRIALTAAYGRYDHAGERLDLLEYCDGLHRLLEAAFILQRRMAWEAEGNVKRELSENIKHDLLTAEQTFQLSEEEIKDPYAVIKAFFETFTSGYARRELWEMLACVVEQGPDGKDRLDLLLDFECLHAVLEACWLLYQEQEKQVPQPEEAKPGRV